MNVINPSPARSPSSPVAGRSFRGATRRARRTCSTGATAPRTSASTSTTATSRGRSSLTTSSRDRLLEDDEPEAFATQPIPEDEEHDGEDDEQRRGTGHGRSPRGRRPRPRLPPAHRQAQAAQGARGGRHRRAHRERASATCSRRWPTFRRPCRRSSRSPIASAKGDPAAELILLPEGGELKPGADRAGAPGVRAIKRRRCLHRHPAREARQTRGSASRTRAAHRDARSTAPGAPSSTTWPRSRSGRRSSTTSSPNCVRSTQEFRGARARCRAPSAPSAAARSKRASACRARSSAGDSRASRRPRTSCARPSAS